MRSPVERHSEEAEQVEREIRHAVLRQFPARRKFRIVIAGLHAKSDSNTLSQKPRSTGC